MPDMHILHAAEGIHKFIVFFAATPRCGFHANIHFYTILFAADVGAISSPSAVKIAISSD